MQRSVIIIFENHKFVQLLWVTNGDFLVPQKKQDRKYPEVPVVERDEDVNRVFYFARRIPERVAQEKSIEKCIEYP